jgi:phosphoribosylaminoimidazole carboxylase (NCAIR synthetase)
MMALEAPRIGVNMSFLDPSGDSCPAAQVVPHDAIYKGSLKDDIQDFINKSGNVDVVTVEIEHVGVETLALLESQGVNVQPSARVLGIIRDKYLQKVSEKKVNVS